MIYLGGAAQKILVDSQDNVIKRMQELKDRIEAEKSARAELEANYKLKLADKDAIIASLRTKVIEQLATSMHHVARHTCHTFQIKASGNNNNGSDTPASSTSTSMSEPTTTTTAANLIEFESPRRDSDTAKAFAADSHQLKEKVRSATSDISTSVTQN